MFVSRLNLTLLGVLLLGSTAWAADEQRLSMLAREAADLLAAQASPAIDALPSGDGTTDAPARFGSVPPTGVPGPSLAVWGMLLTALLSGFAAYGGVWFGQRRREAPATATNREDVAKNTGSVREVTWRFRSSKPLRMGSVNAPRVNRVLDEIEDLGRKLRSMTSPEAEDGTAVEATLVPTTEAPTTDMEAPVVEFARRERPAAAEVQPEDEPSPDEVPAPAAESPISPAVATDPPPTDSRKDRYASARALLQSGADHATIQARTGLKFAEIDLLRCTTATEGRGA